MLNTMRATSPNLVSTLNTARTVPDRPRLQQSTIFEAFLAMLALCALRAYSTLNIKRVLPKNPCSMASMESLLAGVDMLVTCFPPVRCG